MSSPSKDNEEPTSSGIIEDNGVNVSEEENIASKCPRPPAKRRLSNTVIEISDTESDDSDICAVTTYQASADEVKRIRGADYSSTSSSSSEYSSDSESPWEDDSILIEDEQISSKVVQAQLFPRANRMEDPKLNSKFKSQELIDSLTSHWQSFNDLKTDEVTLTCDPFRLCLLHDLLSNPDFINNIIDDMNTLDWSRKKLDLFEFHQTADLASLTWQRSIKGIYELLKTEIMTWVSSVTGLQLQSVSASCSLYGPGDRLLVHDDLLGDRRVAFILYLAPWGPVHRAHTNGDQYTTQAVDGGWSDRMGGALELLATEDGVPTTVKKRVLPHNNMLAFFKVGNDSYHQVEEVLSMELPRLSINGWFHGPAPEHEPPAPPDTYTPPEHHKPHNETVVLSQWVSPGYMSPRARLQLQQHMEAHSEASLHELLLPDKVEQLLAQLESPDMPWEAAGPAHKRRYSRVSGAAARGCGGALAELVQLVTSQPYTRLLADCTDLQLLTYHSLELQRWTPGDFTLLPSREQYSCCRLETTLWLRGGGGGAALTYVSAEERGAAPALVQMAAAHNALSLVYCDAGAAPFHNYVSRLAPRPHHYTLSCVYCE